jgi:hypothetical protein
MLVKIAPIAIHYSSPYCHFQNNAENYIKSFKRCFLKMLNDVENPHARHDWALLLPTVTQALNRRVILSLGVSREAIHYNSPSCYYPLAELPNADNADYNEIFDAIHPNIYERIKNSRTAKLTASKKRQVPIYHVNQLVFAVDQSPSAPGVTSILKLPTVGPFRISSVDARNVTLIDIATGKQHTSHVELIRPINLTEFKLILSNKWDLNAQFTKSAQPPRTRSQFDTAPAPMDKKTISEQENAVPEIEDEIGLERLFYPAPAPAPAPTGLPPAPAPLQGLLQSVPAPANSPNAPAANLAPAPRLLSPEPDPLQDDSLAPAPQPVASAAPAPDDLVDEFDADLSFNSYQIDQELSKEYKKSLIAKPKKVSFIQKIQKLFN